MAPRAFVIYPHKALREVANPVAKVDDTILALWDEMLEAMYAMPGVGLGAPQFGVGLRVVVVDASDTGRAPIRLANPELLEASPDLRAHTEGSPNLPGLFAPIARPDWVRVCYMDETGAVQERRFDGLWATSVQHQIDHLNGILFFDHLSPVKRRILLTKHEKLKRKAAR